MRTRENTTYHYLNSLRLLSCLMVIALHTSSKQWYIIPMDEPQWAVVTVYNSLLRCAFSLFFMISGVLFINPEKEYPIKQLLGKNVARIVVAFLFWSGFYTLLGHIDHGNTPLELGRNWLYGHYHLSFLYALGGMYLLVPILREIARKKQVLEYFLILNFIFVPCTTLLSFNPTLATIIENISNRSHFYLVTGYTGFFMLGSYLHRFPLHKNKRFVLHFMAICSYCITISGTYLLSHYEGQPTETFFRYFLPTTYCAGISIFVWVQHLKIPTFLQGFIDILAPLTFGVYLLHDYFLVLFLVDMGWIYSNIPVILNIPLFTLVIFSVCALLVSLLRSIPILGKWIV